MAHECRPFLRENYFILHGVIPTGEEIGRGAYGRVFEVDYEGTLCAAKEIHELLLQHAQGDALQKIKDDFIHESQIWSTLHHPCVVQFLGLYYPEANDSRLPVMVMEKMEQSLRALVEKYDNIPLNVKLSILHEVCCGIRYLHSRNPPIIHRDLTPNNILLGGCLEAKITDLGMAKVMQGINSRTMTMAPGTVDFMPPESLADRPVYGLPLDIFSFGGIVLFTIVALWPQPSSWVQFHPDTGERILVSEWQRRKRYLDMMTGSSVDLKPLVISCLNDNPKNRPLIVEVTAKIKEVKDYCSHNSNFEGMTPIAWWNMASAEQQSSLPQITSLTNQLQEMSVKTEELMKKNNTLEEENMQIKSEMLAKITSLTNQLQETSVKTDEIMKKNSTLEEENMQIKSELLEKVTSLTSQLQEMSVKTEELMKKNSTLEEENMQLENKLLAKQQQVVLNHEDNSTRTVNIEWKEGAAAPASRVLHTAVSLNGLVYVGGCYHDTKEQILHRIDIYDVSFNSWSNSPIFTPYRYFAMTTLNNRLIIAGGRDYHNKTTDMILTFENGAKKLKEYATMTTAKCSVTAAGHLGMLIIAGGVNSDGGGLASTEVLDSATGQWHICNALPEPCSWQQSVILSNHLYLVGGYGPDSHASSIVFSSSLDSLSTYQLNWKSYQNLPWWLPAAADLNGTDLIILGGLKTPNDVPVRTSNIYMFNSDTDSHSWEIIGHIPSKRGAPAAVAVGNNKIIVIGGRSFNGSHTNTVWIGLCEAQEP